MDKTKLLGIAIFVIISFLLVIGKVMQRRESEQGFKKFDQQFKKFEQSIKELEQNIKEL